MTIAVIFEVASKIDQMKSYLDTTAARRRPPSETLDSFNGVESSDLKALCCRERSCPCRSVPIKPLLRNGTTYKCPAGYKPMGEGLSLRIIVRMLPGGLRDNWLNNREQAPNDSRSV